MIFNNPRVEVPAHVPAHLVHDFDLYALPGLNSGDAGDIHRLWKAFQDQHPAIFWTPRNGGHWVLTRQAVMQEAALNPEVFSSSDIFVPRGTSPFLTPTNMDPPAHSGFRRLLLPTFSPAMLGRATDRARAAAVEMIEDLKPRGGCEFMSEFAAVMPVIAFMTLVNLPLEDLPHLRGVAGTLTPGRADSQDSWGMLSAYVAQQIALRRDHPQDDFISSLLSETVDGRPLTPDEIFSMTLLVISGGLDTVALSIGFAAAFLAQNPAHRRELIAHPERIDEAIEELFRRFGISNIARVTTRDTTLGGAELRAGESVLMLFPLAGLDDTVNEDPLTVDFQRKNKRHLIFGSGAHMCVGNRLARREMRLFIEEWLGRIPDFALAPGTKPSFSSGVTNRIDEMRFVW